MIKPHQNVIWQFAYRAGVAFNKNENINGKYFQCHVESLAECKLVFIMANKYVIISIKRSRKTGLHYKVKVVEWKPTCLGQIGQSDLRWLVLLTRSINISKKADLIVSRRRPGGVPYFQLSPLPHNFPLGPQKVIRYGGWSKYLYNPAKTSI